MTAEIPRKLTPRRRIEGATASTGTIDNGDPRRSHIAVLRRSSSSEDSARRIGTNATEITTTANAAESPYPCPPFCFANENAFVAAMQAGGNAALELCARDMRG